MDASYPTLSCAESSDTPPSRHFPLFSEFLYYWIIKSPFWHQSTWCVVFSLVFASKTSLEALGRSEADLFYRDYLGRVEKLYAIPYQCNYVIISEIIKEVLFQTFFTWIFIQYKVPLSWEQKYYRKGTYLQGNRKHPFLFKVQLPGFQKRAA